ncbi:MAG: RidA family protein [Planctomycetota bacterium]
MNETPSDGPWRTIEVPGLARPIGYAYGVESVRGRHITIAGKVAMDASGAVVHRGDMVAQAEMAFGHVKAVLDAAGARPEHLVRLRIFVTDIPAYQRESKAIGTGYRKHFGRHYPAMTLVQVVRLFDEGALIEVEGEAVVPDAGSPA